MVAFFYFVVISIITIFIFVVLLEKYASKKEFERKVSGPITKLEEFNEKLLSSSLNMFAYNRLYDAISRAKKLNKSKILPHESIGINIGNTASAWIFLDEDGNFRLAPANYFDEIPEYARKCLKLDDIEKNIPLQSLSWKYDDDIKRKAESKKEMQKMLLSK